MNYRKLRGLIKEKYGTQAAFAAAMPLNPSSLSAKLNNKVPWTRDEIERACELLSIPLELVYVYFFSPEVEKTQLIREEAI